MSKVLRRQWPAAHGDSLSRRDRQGCEYEAYVPDPLESRRVLLDGDVAADVADAEAALGRFDATATALADTEAIARLLLRAESVASSYIEGLAVGGRRLVHAEAARASGLHIDDVTADEVLANIDATTWAIESLASASSITVGGLLEIHRRLLARTHLAEHAGHVRDRQNWIGGNGYNPCSAAFVPPPPAFVSDLLDDLCAFCNADALPAVAQAAIAHAQFETIHPFVDGNGRAGRALIHVILRRRGTVPRVLAPISLVLAANSKSYVAGLTATRYRGRADSMAAHEGVNRWIATFAAACTSAVARADEFERQVATIEQEWRARLGRVRSKSAIDLLLRKFPGAPVVTVEGAAELIGRSYQATNEAIARLEGAQIVRQISIGRRNRAFEATKVVDAFTDLERQLNQSG